jgi:hypothetical protein
MPETSSSINRAETCIEFRIGLCFFSFQNERKFYKYFAFVWFIIPAQLKGKLIIFIFNQRRMRRPPTYTFSNQQVLAAMGQIEEGSPKLSFTPKNG